MLGKTSTPRTNCNGATLGNPLNWAPQRSRPQNTATPSGTLPRLVSGLCWRCRRGPGNYIVSWHISSKSCRSIGLNASKKLSSGKFDTDMRGGKHAGMIANDRAVVFQSYHIVLDLGYRVGPSCVTSPIHPSTTVEVVRSQQREY